MQWIRICPKCGEIIYKDSLTESRNCKCGWPWGDDCYARIMTAEAVSKEAGKEVVHAGESR